MADVQEVDPVVRAALRRLPVPDHGPDFWDRLDAELMAQEPANAVIERRAPVVRPVTVPPVETDPVELARLARRRRRSNRALALVAAAAAVVAVVAASALLRNELGDSEVDTTPRASGTSEQPGTVTTDGAAAVTAVDAWLAALAEGDTATAWELLSPTGQEPWGDEERFASEASGLAEGYGAWASVEPEVALATTVADTDDGSIQLVTLVGDLAQEGTTRPAVLSLPVRVGPDGGRIEPAPVSAGGLEAVAPPAIGADGTVPTLEPDAQLAVDLPPGCGSPLLRLDAGPVLVPGSDPGATLGPGERGSPRATYRPGDIAAGDHVLIAACVDPESGIVFPFGALFAVE